MTYYVHSVERDMGGNWYARVVISTTEAIFLKFQDYPSMSDIQIAAAISVEQSNSEIAE